MAKKVEIEVDIKGNIVESSKNLKALKQQLKELPAGTSEWSKIKNDIRDIEDSLEAAGQSSEDFKGLLENAPGPLGALGGAIKKVELATKSWGAAIKATGIGLLVSLIGGLVGAFASVEGSGKKFEKLIIGFEKIFQGILTALEPVIDAVVDLAERAMPFVTDAFRVAYSAVSSFLQGIGKLGQAVMKLIKGDFSGAWDSAKDAVMGFGERYEEASDAFIEGSNRVTKTEKKNLEDQNAAREKALAEKLKQMEAQDKLDEAQLEKMKAEAMALATTEQQKLDIEKKFAKISYDLKKKDLEDKQKLYKKDSVEYKGYATELINLEKDFINESSKLKDTQRELNKQKLEQEKADRKEFYEKDKATFSSQMQERQRSVDTANEKELQALDIKLKKGQIKEYEYQESLYNLKKEQLAKGLNQLNFAEQQEKMHYENLYQRGKINKEDYENALLDIQKRYGDQRVANLKAAGENEFNEAVRLANLLVQTKEYEKNAIIQLEQAKISAVATLGNILSQLAGDNKNLAILGLAVQQGAAIADILTRFFRTKATLIGQKAIYAAMIPNPVTAAIGIAGVSATTAGLTANTIGMAAGLAGVGAAVAQGIAAINAKSSGAKTSSEGSAAAPQANLGRNYGDGGMINGPLHAQGGVMINAEGGEAVMTRGAVTAFGPLLSAMNQMGGGRSFGVGSNQGAAYDQPQLVAPVSTPMVVKTYVVSNELTSEQEKQAKLKSLSTL